eukprot:364039-Chlamydomonas_euryale.AAC.6
MHFERRRVRVWRVVWAAVHTVAEGRTIQGLQGPCQRPCFGCSAWVGRPMTHCVLALRVNAPAHSCVGRSAGGAAAAVRGACRV